MAPRPGRVNAPDGAQLIRRRDRAGWPRRETMKARTTDVAGRIAAGRWS